jgi:hypothetical protein
MSRGMVYVCMSVCHVLKVSCERKLLEMACLLSRFVLIRSQLAVSAKH